MTWFALARVALAPAALVLGGCFLFPKPQARCPKGRTVTLTSQDDIAAFAGCRRAQSVVIRTSGVVNLAPLAQLRQIDGDLVIGPTQGLEEAGLNGIEHVRGAIRVSGNANLRGFYLARMLDGGRVVVDDNPVLRTIALPRAQVLHGPLVAVDNPRLELLTAAQLARVDRDIVLGGDPKLANVELAHLASADGVRIDDTQKLPAGLAEFLEQLPAYPPLPSSHSSPTKN